MKNSINDSIFVSNNLFYKINIYVYNLVFLLYISTGIDSNHGDANKKPKICESYALTVE